MKIVVSSTNPVKLAACKQAFEKYFSPTDLEFIGENVESGVADQPFTESETITGATNRVINAKNVRPEADYWVGIEGGLEERDGELLCYAWVMIAAKASQKLGKGRSASFFLPKQFPELIKQGKNMSEADDQIFGRENSRASNGTIGVITKDQITRTSLYEAAVVMALIPFLNPELY